MDMEGRGLFRMKGTQPFPARRPCPLQIDVAFHHFDDVRAVTYIADLFPADFFARKVRQHATNGA
ncbi:MAG TPA: hypothetical protein VGG33_15715, partial [Polyangia bacterium]